MGYCGTLAESLGKCQASGTCNVNTRLNLGKHYILMLFHTCCCIASLSGIFLKVKYASCAMSHKWYLPSSSLCYKFLRTSLLYSFFSLPPYFSLFFSLLKHHSSVLPSFTFPFWVYYLPTFFSEYTSTKYHAQQRLSPTLPDSTSPKNKTNDLLVFCLLSAA